MKTKMKTASKLKMTLNMKKTSKFDDLKNIDGSKEQDDLKNKTTLTLKQPQNENERLFQIAL